MCHGRFSHVYRNVCQAGAAMVLVHYGHHMMHRPRSTRSARRSIKPNKYFPQLSLIIKM